MDYNTLLVEIVNKVLENTDLSAVTTPGSVVRTLSEVLAKYFTNLYDYITFVSRNAYLDTADTYHLNLIASLFNLDRLGTTFAHDISKANVKFFIDPIFDYTATDLVGLIPADITESTIDRDNHSFTILQGTNIYNKDKTKAYSTLDDITFIGSDTEHFVNVLSVETGDLANVGIGELSIHGIKESQIELYSIADYILVENVQPIINGQNLESDENFRYRIKNRINQLMASDSMEIRLAALSVPGVADVTIKKHANGIGTTSVLVIGASPIIPDGVLNAVSEACNRVVAAGEKVKVISSLYRSIHMCVDLTYDTKNQKYISDAKISITNKIIDYINNIETDLIIGDIKTLILETDHIQDYKISCFSSGFYERSSGQEMFLEDMAITNQRTGWNEKFYTNNSMINVC